MSHSINCHLNYVFILKIQLALMGRFRWLQLNIQSKLQYTFAQKKIVLNQNNITKLFKKLFIKWMWDILCAREKIINRIDKNPCLRAAQILLRGENRHLILVRVPVQRKKLRYTSRRVNFPKVKQPVLGGAWIQTQMV